MIKMIKNLPPISQLLIFDKILERRMRARHEVWWFTIPVSSPLRNLWGIENRGGSWAGVGGGGEEGGEREGENVRQGELACILEEGTAQK